MQLLVLGPGPRLVVTPARREAWASGLVAFDVAAVL
jgi:hypothetical protein